MIQLSYIHALDEPYLEDADSIRINGEIDSILTDIFVMESRANDMKAFGLFTESSEEYFQESVKNAVENLGNKIIELFEKLKKFIADAISRFTDITGKKRDVDAKMKAIERMDKNKADKIKVAISQGDLDIASFKSISEMNKEIDKLLDDIEKNKIDPTSFRGRMDALRRKLANNADTIKTATSIFTAAASVGTVYVSWRNFTSSKMDKEMDPKRLAAEAEERSNILRAKLNIIDGKNGLTTYALPKRDPKTGKRIGGSEDHSAKLTANTKMGMIAQLAQFTDEIYRSNVTKREKFMNSTIVKFDSIVSKLIPKLSSDEHRSKNIASLQDKYGIERQKADNRSKYLRDRIKHENKVADAGKSKNGGKP